MSLDRLREGRDFENRAHDTIMFGQADHATFDIFYNFPKHKMPGGMQYVWGNFDNKNLSRLIDRGYRLVPAARHPEYVCHQFTNEKPIYIFKKNQVLLEIQKELFNRLRHNKVAKLRDEAAAEESKNIRPNQSRTISFNN